MKRGKMIECANGGRVSTRFRQQGKVTILISVLSMVLAGYAAGNSVRSSVPAEVKVVIIGDSTVSTYTTGEKRGWGQQISGLFDTRAAFDNRALSGRSTKTFITQGKWASTLSTLQSNDYVLIQFGHNDSHNPANSESTDAFGDYQVYLQQYIDEAQAKGAAPILVTPMHRNNFDAAGKLLSYGIDRMGVTNDLAPYAAAMKQVAQANGLTCIDLFTSSGQLMQPIGEAGCTELLASGDKTHWNEKGAIAMAALVTRGIANSDEALKEYIRDGALSAAILSATASDCSLVEAGAYRKTDVSLKWKDRSKQESEIVSETGDLYQKVAHFCSQLSSHP